MTKEQIARSSKDVGIRIQQHVFQVLLRIKLMQNLEMFFAHPPRVGCLPQGGSGFIPTPQSFRAWGNCIPRGLGGKPQMIGLGLSALKNYLIRGGEDLSRAEKGGTLERRGMMR